MYAAPEIMLGKAYGSKVDVFSYGKCSVAKGFGQQQT